MLFIEYSLVSIRDQPLTPSLCLPFVACRQLRTTESIHLSPYISVCSLYLSAHFAGFDVTSMHVLQKSTLWAPIFVQDVLMQGLYAAFAVLQYNAHIVRSARAVVTRLRQAALASASRGWQARAAAMRGARLLLQHTLAGGLQHVFDAWW